MKINELDKNTIKELIKIFPRANHIDIVVSTDGKDLWFEGDFLKEILLNYKEILK